MLSVIIDEKIFTNRINKIEPEIFMTRDCHDHDPIEILAKTSFTSRG
jgi:hypothetical protein